MLQVPFRTICTFVSSKHKRVLVRPEISTEKVSNPRFIMLIKSQAIIEERPIDSKRPLGVICVSAGISRIITAIRFPQRIPILELQIYEKNPDIAGTSFENQCPGCACGELRVHATRSVSEDIPAHTSNSNLSRTSNGHSSTPSRLISTSIGRKWLRSMDA